MLLNGYKFDVKIYVIVMGGTLSKQESENNYEGTIQAYMLEEGMAQFCTEPFKKAKKDNFKKTSLFLSNNQSDKTPDNFISEMKVDDILEPNSCSKKTLTALWKEI